MSIVAGIYKIVIADTSITDKLSKYNFDSNTPTPAVFSYEPAPEDAGGKLITINQIGGAAPVDLRDRAVRGYIQTIDVRIWGNKGHSQKEIRDIADQLLLLLDRAIIEDDNFCVLGCKCEPAGAVADPDGFPGFSLVCNVQTRVKE